MTNTLNLTIAEPWFSKIASGEKLEEYREFEKSYAIIDGRQLPLKNAENLLGT